MLFDKHEWPGLVDGSITLAFRRWRSPHAKVGSVHRIPGGTIAIDAVDVVTPDRITETDAHGAGAGSRAALITRLDAHDSARGDAPIYRIAFHFAGPDPRVALRERAELSEDETAAILRRLERLDASSPHGAWTARTLALIADRPGVRAPDLAASVGRDTLPFKRDVRKLKELGLTESLRIGYRLSPRGVVVRTALEG
jgi:hypothetical protein